MACISRKRLSYWCSGGPSPSAFSSLVTLCTCADLVGEGIDFRHCIIGSRSCESDCTASAIMISGEPLFPSLPGETSGPSPKRRSCKRLQDLPDGWTVQERVRFSGKSAGKTYKFFIEPGTRKKFRSMPEVRRHLGMAIASR